MKNDGAGNAPLEEIMKYVKEGAMIFGITMAGEGLNYVLPLPVPSGVYGLFLLLVLLCTGVLKVSDIEATGNFLLDIMPVLFIPASVGLIESYADMKAFLMPLVVICMISTLVVMVVTGRAAEWMLGRRGRGQHCHKDGGQQG